jgi:hypothetical protein
LDIERYCIALCAHFVIGWTSTWPAELELPLKTCTKTS